MMLYVLLLCFCAVVPYLIYWLYTVENRKYDERKIQFYAQRALQDYGEYTSYKICNGFILVILDDKTGTITVCPLSSPTSLGKYNYTMSNVEKIDTLVVKGKTVTESKTKWVSRSSKSSMAGNVIGAAVMLNTFGIGVLTSPRKKIEKQTTENTYTISDQHYVCVYHHVGKKLDQYQLPVLDENEMNEVCDYLCRFVERQSEEEEEEYF